ncbi:membrane protein US20 [Panine betaherpesvirus 2]|uniref:Membrane protein US20 n=1 Tax=Panine betaherpesvirus 2 TaxID=188763 RepID=Q8QRT9_9BETA|nr:membrane protein US20 [Panine betaherpesvirus 2]AAM00799.1 membrane protein US20 [Panine betaherpesvirus 2]
MQHQEATTLLLSRVEALEWFKRFTVWLRVYAVLVFQLAFTFGLGSVFWLGFPQNRNFCVENYSFFLTVLVPIVCMFVAYTLGNEHPSNVTVMFIYLLANSLTAAIFQMCSESRALVGAYVMTVALFITFTGLAFLGGRDPYRWRCISCVYALLVLSFLALALSGHENWMQKLIMTLSAFSISFFLGILAYDTLSVIFYCQPHRCIRYAICLYLDVMALFLMLILMLSGPHWIRVSEGLEAGNATARSTAVAKAT